MSFKQSASIETNTWWSLHLCIIPGRRHWERTDGLLGASSSPVTETWLPAWDHGLQQPEGKDKKTDTPQALSGSKPALSALSV